MENLTKGKKKSQIVEQESFDAFVLESQARRNSITESLENAP